ILAICIILLLGFMAIFGAKISGHNYFDNDLINANKPPSKEHWFGTDNLGRDLFARTWEGAKISLFIGLTATFIDLVIGVIWGAVSGYIGGRVDEILMRIADILSALPYLPVVILLMVVLRSEE